MFAGNDRITSRQLYFQIVMSMTGILVVILPGFGGIYGWQGILCCEGALVIWFGYAFFLVRISSHYSHLNFFLSDAGKKLYGIWTILVYILMGAYMTSVTAQLVNAYLIPGVSISLVKGILLVGCSMAGIPRIQCRGRMAEAIFPVLGGIFVLLLLVSLGQQLIQMDTFGEYLLQPIIWDEREIVNGIYTLFAVSTGLWGLPFLLHQVKGRRYFSIVSAFGTVLLILAAVLLILQGSYGREQVLARSWPVVSLMGGIRIPGGFVFRMDPIWICVLMLMLMFSIGSALFYGNAIAKAVGFHWHSWWLPVAVYGVSLLPTGLGMIEEYYNELLRYILCPVTVLLHIVVGLRILTVREKYTKREESGK